MFLLPWCLALFFAASARADNLTLPPIIVEGSAADALLYDPVIPVRESKVTPATSDGSIVRELSEELPFPVQDNAVPGTTSLIRGSGRTADDTNVQVFGVPLNPGLGGGFDFSTFPQFVWSEYRFQIGPSSGGYDPRAASSTLTLVPWTETALGSASARVTETVTRGLNQASVAGSYGPAALLVGLSSVNASGPTGSASFELLRRENFEIRAHLLATSLDETSPGSIGALTPNAQYQVNRVIPLLEGSAKFGDVLIKQTFFYDRNSIRYNNPDNSIIDSYDRSNQEGAETAALWNDWKAGFSIHRDTFAQIGFSAPDEWTGRISLSRVERLDPWTLNATVEGDAQTTDGVKPGAQAGVRYDFSDALDAFFKTSFSYRFPTVQDRYYNLFGILPNPGLAPEQSLMLNSGVEWRKGRVETDLQGIVQFRHNAQIFIFDQTQNAGDVEMESLVHDLTFHATKNVDFTNTARLGYSKIDSLGYRVPYDPLFTEAVQGVAHAQDWRAGAAVRAVTRSPVSPGLENAGYGWLDLFAGYGFSGLSFEARVDNVMNRPIEVVSGYPSPGRLFAFSAVGQL